jgi:8-oxo-dGTP diphosphatase
VEEKCPRCGCVILRHRNPVPTVDIIIELRDRGLVLIQRANPPYGWALPGGFVDYGESLEDAARREAREETGLKVALLGQLHTYSDPQRDPRQHTITTVFVASSQGTPKAADDARSLEIFATEDLPRPLAFDHARILADYLKVRPEWLEKIEQNS